MISGTKKKHAEILSYFLQNYINLFGLRNEDGEAELLFVLK